MLAYTPVFILIQLFKRSSGRLSKSKRLQKAINKLKGKENIEKLQPKTDNCSMKKFKFIFPWWFKIILYCISFICMALSIFILVFIGIFNRIFKFLNFKLLNTNFIKGISFGNENVRNWLITCIFSFLIGIFFTLPFQVN